MWNVEATTLTIQLLVKFRKSYLLRQTVRPKGEVGRSIKKKNLSDHSEFNQELSY